MDGGSVRALRVSSPEGDYVLPARHVVLAPGPVSYTHLLRDIFRQAGQSMIVRNAHLVNTGMPPQLKNAAANDFFFRCV